MIPIKEDRSNTFTTFPTRKFRFILDPSCILSKNIQKYLQISELIKDLESVEPKILNQVMLPEYLSSPEALTKADSMKLDLIRLSRIKTPTDFELKKSIRKEIEKAETYKSGQNKILNELLALSDLYQADGIITNNSILISLRYSLYQYHMIRIIHLNEFADTIEVIAHGNSIFWSTSNHERKLNADIFYPMCHWKCSRLFRWFQTVSNKIENNELRENLRNALLNRYPFILYSRDMVRFYELQYDHYTRRGHYQPFNMVLSCFLNNFYFLIWGMLEQLTIIAKYARNLPIDEIKCGIKSKDFWKKFKTYEPGLYSFVQNEKIKNWLNVMADIRHNAAHKVIKMPTQIVAHTDESRMTDEEILKIIKQEKLYLYKFLPEHLLKEFESMYISDWRMKKVEVLSPGMILLENKKGKRYFYPPVVSLDHELSMLTGIMDAFIVKLFSNSNTNK